MELYRTLQGCVHGYQETQSHSDGFGKCIDRVFNAAIDRFIMQWSKTYLTGLALRKSVEPEKNSGINSLKSEKLAMQFCHVSNTLKRNKFTMPSQGDQLIGNI